MAHKNSPKTKMREAGRPVNSKTKSNLKAVGKRAQISPVQLQETNLTTISIGPDQHPDRKNSWTANHDRRYNFWSKCHEFLELLGGWKVAKSGQIWWFLAGTQYRWPEKPPIMGYNFLKLLSQKSQKAQFLDGERTDCLLLWLEKRGQEKYSTLWAVCASKT